MMQTSSERVNESVQLAKQAEGALADIKEAISQISQMNFQIATATEEQSAVCEDVNKNITRIAGAVSDTAEAARSLRQLGQQQDIMQPIRYKNNLVNLRCNNLNLILCPEQVVNADGFVGENAEEKENRRYEISRFDWCFHY
ncbi:hypothetical protein [Alishewanella longhuensis]